MLLLAFLLSCQEFVTPVLVGLSFMTSLAPRAASQACVTLAHVHPLTLVIRGSS